MLDEHRSLIGREIPATPTGLILLDHLFRQPVFNIKTAAKVIGRSYPVANELVARFEALGLVRETTGGRRNRAYAYQPYLDLFS